MIRIILILFLVSQLSAQPQPIPNIQMIRKARSQVEHIHQLPKQDYQGLKNWVQYDANNTWLILQYNPQKYFQVMISQHSNDYLVKSTKYIDNNDYQSRLFLAPMISPIHRPITKIPLQVSQSINTDTVSRSNSIVQFPINSNKQPRSSVIVNSLKSKRDLLDDYNEYRHTDRVQLKLNNGSLSFFINYDDDTHSTAKVIKYLNQRNKVQHDLRQQRKEIQRDIGSKVGWFLFQDPEIIGQQKKELKQIYKNITKIRKNVLGTDDKTNKGQQLVTSVQSFMRTVFQDSKYLSERSIKQEKKDTNDRLGRYFYKYLQWKDEGNMDVDEDFKVIFKINDSNHPLLEQTLEYSVKDESLVRYVESPNDNVQVGKKDVELISYIHIPKNSVDFEVALDYLRDRRESVTSVVIKQNKKYSQDDKLGSMKYDFNRVINVTDADIDLVVPLLNGHDLYNEIVISTFEQFLSSDQMQYEIVQDFKDMKPLVDYVGIYGQSYVQSLFQNLFGNLQVIDGLNELLLKNPFFQSTDEEIEQQIIEV